MYTTLSYIGYGCQDTDHPIASHVALVCFQKNTGVPDATGKPHPIAGRRRGYDTMTRETCAQAASSNGGDQHTRNSSATVTQTGASDYELPAHFVSERIVSWLQLILDSYESEVDGGEPLIPDRATGSEEEQARQVAKLPVAILSHDFLRNSEDPIFIYGRE